MSATAIQIGDPTVDGSTLRCEIRCSPDLERFFTGEPLRIEYENSLESVPDSILAIPALAQVCPLAWAHGADVYVRAVDATFASALEDVKASLLGMYDFFDGGTLFARNVVETPAPQTGTDAGGDVSGSASSESGLLFTGGVDSMSAYVRRREERPTLISVRGWTITPHERDDEKWATLRSRVSEFAAERGLETAFIDANMLSVLDHPMVLAHYGHRVDGGWYSSVGHGLGLLGLCAPLAYARGLDTLAMAATHWDGIDLEWGSRPDIDDHVRWTGTRCHHDIYDLTRQERIDLIADYVTSDSPSLSLQTCNERMDGNCGECEKCYRTAVGLRLSGLEPRDHGYPFEDHEYWRIRRSFETGAWILGEDELHMWEDIRARAQSANPVSPAEHAFFTWLETVDLEDCIEHAGSPVHHRVLRTGARHLPSSAYNALYPVWSGAKTQYRRLSG